MDKIKDIESATKGFRCPLVPIYGDRIEVSARLVRATKSGKARAFRYWRREEYFSKGLFLGVRTLQNGEASWDNEGRYFSPIEYFRVAMVSPGKNRNPIYVPCDAIEHEGI